MKSLKFSGEEGIEDFDAEFEGKPIFRKYIYEGQMGRNETNISRIVKKNPHPNIAVIYDFGPDYIDMELLKTNVTLSKIKPFIPALRDAKNFLHSLGIVYLDWKLNNLGVSEEGVVKIFDFDMSSMFLKDRFTEGPSTKGFFWRAAEFEGLKSPIEIDDWIFNQMIKDRESAFRH
jgi:serine/threonine protein kinase